MKPGEEVSDSCLKAGLSYLGLTEVQLLFKVPETQKKNLRSFCRSVLLQHCTSCGSGLSSGSMCVCVYEHVCVCVSWLHPHCPALEQQHGASGSHYSHESQLKVPGAFFGCRQCLLLPRLSFTCFFLPSFARFCLGNEQPAACRHPPCLVLHALQAFRSPAMKRVLCFWPFDYYCCWNECEVHPGMEVIYQLLQLPLTLTTAHFPDKRGYVFMALSP